MDKEEILAASRAEKREERILQINQQAGAVAMCVGAFVCILINIFDLIMDRTNHAPWIVYWCMLGTQNLVQYIKLKKKGNLIVAILGFLLTVLRLASYIIEVFG